MLEVIQYIVSERGIFVEVSDQVRYGLPSGIDVVHSFFQQQIVFQSARVLLQLLFCFNHDLHKGLIQVGFVIPIFLDPCFSKEVATTSTLDSIFFSWYDSFELS
jgi:hypothetical protein